MKRAFLLSITTAIALTTASFTQASEFEGGYGLNVQGQVLGGHLRSGPGVNYPSMGTLPEGTYVTIVFSSEVEYDGHEWYEILMDDGSRGFVWGGILCSNGDKLWGVYASCQQYQNEVRQDRHARNQSVNNARGWMAFAVGHNGRWGHGAGPSLGAARNYALDNCGSSNCQLIDETQAQCHAMAVVPGGHWFGAANSQGQAQRYAIDFCINSGAQGCRIEYTYCQ